MRKNKGHRPARDGAWRLIEGKAQQRADRACERIVHGDRRQLRRGMRTLSRMMRRGHLEAVK